MALRDSIQKTLEDTQDLLIEAGRQLESLEPEQLPEKMPQLDRQLRDAYRLAEDARRQIVLHRPPQYEHFNLNEAVRKLSGQVATMRDADYEPGTLQGAYGCDGDAQQVLACLRLLLNSIKLDSGDRLRTRLSEDHGEPAVEIAIEGKAAIPQEFTLAEHFTMDRQAFAERWAAASKGGHVHFSDEQTAVLTAGGEAEPASVAEQGLAQKAEAMEQASRRLRSWRSAIGDYEPGYASPEEAISLYKDAINKAAASVQAALKA